MSLMIGRCVRSYLSGKSIPSSLVVFAFLFFVLLSAASTHAKDSEYAPSRFDHIDLKLDGQLDDEVWQQAQPIQSWYRQTPNEGVSPSEETTMWLIYDRNAIYLGVHAKERKPQAMMTRSLVRDSYSKEQDGIGLVIDTYNDDRTASGFIVTPAGIRTDLAISNDGEGGRPWNTDWNAFWDAAVQQDSSGWYAEMRIPFSSLRFENHGGEAEMGVILWRYMARNSEFDVFPSIPNRWRYSYYKPSQALDLKLERIQAVNPVYLKPYVLGGVNQNSLLTADSTAYLRDDRFDREIGFDVKYNLTSNLVLDVTANTDFAQIEADDQRINTTRFSLFFPEKRDFFQERAELFTYRFPGGPQRLFQSRRIGIIEGQTVPILGGARLTGRVGPWELGLIEMQTDHAVVEDEKVERENFGVFRLRRQAFESGSYVGAMVTSRTDFKGNYNLVYAADGDIRVFGPQYFRFEFGQSAENGADASKSRFIALVMQRRIRKGFAFGASVAHYGADFNPGIGFFTRPGINRAGYRVQYTWFPAAENPLQNHTITNRIGFIWGTESHALETFSGGLSWEGLSKAGSTFQMGLDFRHELIDEEFDVGDVVIVPNQYDFLQGRLRYGSPAGNPVRFDVEGRAGGFFGGWQVRSQLSPSWTLNKNLSFSLDYEYNRVEIGDQIFDAHLGKVRLRSALNRALSINAFLQYSGADQDLGANVRLRFNPREGTDLFVVFNEAINTSLNPEEPHLPRQPRSQARAILLKYTYTFVR